MKYLGLILKMWISTLILIMLTFQISFCQENEFNEITTILKVKIEQNNGFIEVGDCINPQELYQIIINFHEDIESPYSNDLNPNVDLLLSNSGRESIVIGSWELEVFNDTEEFMINSTSDWIDCNFESTNILTISILVGKVTNQIYRFELCCDEYFNHETEAREIELPLESEKSKSKFLIYDVKGQLIAEKNNYQDVKDFSLHYNLSAGIYFIHEQTNKGIKLINKIFVP